MLFERPSNQRGAQWNARRFCSMKCAQQAKSAASRAGWERRICPICATEYSVRPGHPGVTCAKPECFAQWRRTIGGPLISERLKAEYASGRRKPARGYSLLEERVWEHLRSHGWVWRAKWRADCGWVEMDFADFNRKMNVELDGPEHGFVKRRTLDEARDGALTGEGWLILRIANADVEAAIEDVVARILAWSPASA